VQRRCANDEPPQVGRSINPTVTQGQPTGVTAMAPVSSMPIRAHFVPSGPRVFARAAIHDGSASLVSSPDEDTGDEDTGIGWVCQKSENTGIDRFDPDHLALTGRPRECRDQQFLVAIPK
jgi:hypothetical protein